MNINLSKLYFLFLLSALSTCHMLPNISLKMLHSKEIIPYVSDITQLCLTVYREYPYLYDGTATEYGPYIQQYAQSQNGLACIVFDDNKPIGAIIGTAMHEMDQRSPYQEPFLKNGFDLHSLFYIGELALLKEYRSKLYEKIMYQALEQTIKKTLQFSHTCFCTVIDQRYHSLRPPNFWDLDIIFGKLGFTQQKDFKVSIPWLDLSFNKVVPHEMVYWLKNIES